MVHGCWPKLCVRFAVLMAVLMKVLVYRGVMLCALVYMYWSQHLTGASRLHVLGIPRNVGMFVSWAMLMSYIFIASHIALKVSEVLIWYCALTFISFNFSSYQTFALFIYLLIVFSSFCSQQIMGGITGSFSKILDISLHACHLLSIQVWPLWFCLPIRSSFLLANVNDMGMFYC
jgi:hypothetical protein